MPLRSIFPHTLLRRHPTHPALATLGNSTLNLPLHMDTIAHIFDNFAALETWEDKYRYLIELGNGLEPLQPHEKTPDRKVQGCVSQVWLVPQIQQNDKGQTLLFFRSSSDAHIVRGLLAVLLTLYSGKTTSDILAADPHAAFSQLGLHQHLSPQRSNGFYAIVKKIRQIALNAQASPPV